MWEDFINAVVLLIALGVITALILVYRYTKAAALLLIAAGFFLAGIFRLAISLQLDIVLEHPHVWTLPSYVLFLLGAWGLYFTTRKYYKD